LYHNAIHEAIKVDTIKTIITTKEERE
jgi:hypothetical protein